MEHIKADLIVVVDDNPQNIKVLANILAENDYEPAVFLSAQEALTFLKKEKPELILLDVMMPEMDGFEFCSRLKADITTNRIPVIFITGKSETEDIVNGFNVGAADYVTKPFQTAELLARIRTHIGLKKAREEIEVLRGFLPMCANCKKVRDTRGIWNQLERYLEEHADVRYTHSLCGSCIKELYSEEDWYIDSFGKDPSDQK